MNCSKHHFELINGQGKCSVPMWRNGMPAGFCDADAFGTPTNEGETRYSRYVPGLACYTHGGPKSKAVNEGRK